MGPQGIDSNQVKHYKVTLIPNMEIRELITDFHLRGRASHLHLNAKSGSPRAESALPSRIVFGPFWQKNI